MQPSPQDRRTRKAAVRSILLSFALASAASGKGASAQSPTSPDLQNDPVVRRIVEQLQSLDAAKPIEPLAVQRQIDPFTGYSYGLVTLRRGLDIESCWVNETTGTITVGVNPTRAEAEALLQTLPPAYRKLGPQLLAKVRETQGGTLGGPIGIDAEFEVEIFVDSAEALNAVGSLPGATVVQVLDFPAMFAAVGRAAEAPPIRAVVAKPKLSILLRIADQPGVRLIEPMGRVTPRLDVSVPRIGGNVIRGYGLTAADTRLAIIDTGVDGTHPALTGRLAVATNFSGDGGVNDTDDTDGHGTHVAGIAASADVNNTGMATQAQILNAKVIPPAAPGTQVAVNSGLIWANLHNARATNISLGSSNIDDDGTSLMTRAVDYQVFHNNRMIAVAGEYSPFSTDPSAPNDNFNAITVGPSNIEPNPSVIATEAANGPTDDGRSKPDVIAPGAVGAILPGSPGITSCNALWEGDPNPDFVDSEGSSMATPHVTGLAAMLWQWGNARNLLTDTPYLKAAIVNTCTRSADWLPPPGGGVQPLDTNEGAGEVNALAAFREYADNDRIWQQRFTSIDNSHWYWIDVVGAPVDVVVTLVFERHVNDPTTTPPAQLNNLQLFLYNPSHTPVAASISPVDSVEHIVHRAVANGRYCIQVLPSRLDTDNWELYALACNFRMGFCGTVDPCHPDFGDAREPFGAGPPGRYPSLLASNGARHADWTKEWLGFSRPEIDGEFRKGASGAAPSVVVSRVDPFPSVSGEDNYNAPAYDEDGVPNHFDMDQYDDGVRVTGPFIPGELQVYQVKVQCTVNKTGVGANGRYDQTNPRKRLYLNGWADWNGNGDWDDLEEKVLGTDSPTGQIAIDPETFGPDGQYNIGESYSDSNGSGAWEPGEPFTDTVGETDRLMQFAVSVPMVDIAPIFYLRFRLDYGEDAGAVANVSGNLAGPRGAAQFGEVEDYYWHNCCDHPSTPEVTCDIFPVSAYSCDAAGGTLICYDQPMCMLDCNDNNVTDSTEIAADPTIDCFGLPGMGNGLIDECEPDCNGNNMADSCELAQMLVPDCNGNGVPDSCDVTTGGVADCNSNGVPDSCEAATTDCVAGLTDPTLRLSLGASGEQADNLSSYPISISGNGRYVVFSSMAANLTPDDANSTWDVFVRDRDTDADGILDGSGAVSTQIVSVALAGGSGNGSSQTSSALGSTGQVSDNGRIVFQSAAGNLVAADPNGSGVFDVFLRDLNTSVTTRIAGVATSPVISANGNWVAFRSSDVTLLPPNTGSTQDIYCYNVTSGLLTRISVATDGTQGNLASDTPAISADGRFVAFISQASNLVPGDTNGVSDVFLRDRDTDVDGVYDESGAVSTTRVSVSSGGAQVAGASDNIAMSATGGLVAFRSYATSIVPDDTNGTGDVFLRDLVSGTTTRVSVGDAGAQTNGDSYLPAISPNGNYVVFSSAATNLAADDTNAAFDVFVHDRANSRTMLLSRSSTGVLGNVDSAYAAVGADNRSVVFLSSATNLVMGDTNALADAFVRVLRDCNANTQIDRLEAPGVNFCTNGVPDVCENDCNSNGIADSCDIRLRLVPDIDGNGIPDGCETVPCNSCDVDCSGTINISDIPPFVTLLTTGGATCSPCAGDVNHDGTLDGRDIPPFVNMLVNGGSCP